MDASSKFEDGRTSVPNASFRIEDQSIGSMDASSEFEDGGTSIPNASFRIED